MTCLHHASMYTRFACDDMPARTHATLLVQVFGKCVACVVNLSGISLPAWYEIVQVCMPPFPPGEAMQSAVLKTKKPATKRKPAATGKRRGRLGMGQADKLPGAAWALWTHQVQSTGPSWLYPVVCLGHLLCLRVTEVLSLSGKDFDLEKGIVRVRALKRQAATDKVLSEAAVAFVCKLQEEGISVNRVKNTGVLGIKTVADSWNWPEEPEEYLFPSTRRDSKKKENKRHGGPCNPERQADLLCPPHPGSAAAPHQEPLRAPPLHQ